MYVVRSRNPDTDFFKYLMSIYSIFSQNFRKMLRKRKRFPVSNGKFGQFEQGRNKTELVRDGNRHGRCK